MRISLIILLALLSLLAIVPTPSHYIWYITIMVTEFPWVFLAITIALLIWSANAERLKALSLSLCIIAFLCFLYPVIGAYMIGLSLNKKIEAALGPGSDTLTGLHQRTPYAFWRMISGIPVPSIPFTTYHYATHTGVSLTLDFYPSQLPGPRPCIVVAHGGSWRSGNSRELPDIDWYLARQGYNVASINYRLAPEYKTPAPIQDMQAAIAYLKTRGAQLNIDTTNFVLLGRSAGGHIVLQSAYTLNDPDIKGVVALYGPTDMVWAYHNPDNPLVMHSRKVMRDFLGGSDTDIPQTYFDASPINFVTPASTPTLLIHGRNDAHVNYELSRMLADKLQQNNVKHFLLTLPWATHGCEYTLNGPSGQLAKYTIERFIHQVTRTDKKPLALHTTAMQQL